MQPARIIARVFPVTLTLVFAGGLLASAPHPSSAEGRQSLEARIIDIARELAHKSYSPPANDLPAALTGLTQQQFHEISYRTERALWRDDHLFSVRFFHRGFLYRDRVTIHIVEDDQIRELPFDRDMFDYDGSGLTPEEVPKDLGFAGLRVLYPLNRADRRDEVLVFLGASYFRLLGRNQVYGVSARGLAIDTALPEGEEFPAFREFWLVRPKPDATSMTIYALLDSKSVTGTYRFDLHPGGGTTVDVKATLFARTDIRKLGLAPLTSMFLYGENSTRFHDNYRPEVHDSDGLLVHTGHDEWIWRPLTNPKNLRVTSLLDEAPRGFGLMQRDRAFRSYLDADAAYERRPSLWVKPEGQSWGKGAVQLVEIPSPSETNDNIVAFWVPDQPLRAGQERDISYQLRSFTEMVPPREVSHVVRTRNAWAGQPGSKDKTPRQVRQFVIDFAGDELATLDKTQPVNGQISTSAGTISNFRVRKLPDSEDWRASFRLTPDGKKPADMRLYLDLRGRRLTETWSYVWSPDEVE